MPSAVAAADTLSPHPQHVSPALYLPAIVSATRQLPTKTFDHLPRTRHLSSSLTYHLPPNPPITTCRPQAPPAGSPHSPPGTIYRLYRLTARTQRCEDALGWDVMGGREWAGGSAGGVTRGGVEGLIEAVKKGHPRHVKLLLEAGVPVNDTGEEGSTALVATVLHCQDEALRSRLLRLLLEAGADPNVGDDHGTTPLMHAASTNMPDVVITLLQHSELDPGLQDGDGNSALMYAAAFGHREVVLLILAAFKQLHHVAYHGQRNGQGLTASQLAERNGHEDIAALLKVEDAVFPRPAGPSAFIPAHPLDLDRPPTPTETRSIRSSFRRAKAAAKTSVPQPPDPTAPLPPPVTIKAVAKSVKSRGSGKLSSSLKLSSKLVSRDSWDGDEEPASASEVVLPRREAAVSKGRDVRAALGKSKSIDSIIETGYDPTSARARDRSIVGWETEIEDAATAKKNEKKEEQGRTEPVRVAGPDRLEKQVLEELMRGLALAGSPGSGNEADTESLMECERGPSEQPDDSAEAKMSGGNGRKTAVSGPSGGSLSASTSGQAMPKIDLSASSRSLNRSIQHLVQEDTENRPGHRPPTPARPSLPTLLPGRLLDVSLSASVGSTKSEGRSGAPSRRVTFSSFPRSASEPRSLTVSPTRNLRPDDDDDDEEETVMDLLDSSTRSEGWDHIRGARGRGPSCTPSEGHVVPLPPINQPRFSELGVRGRDGIRGRGGLAGGEDNVLNVAKKTLEQLESVLAPSEGAALPRHIPRTRTSQQIHLET